MNLFLQIQWLFILAIPVATISWTITHEEIFKEPREFCNKCSKEGKSFFKRKFFYVFTCEYCFSHYVALLIIILVEYKLLMPGWKGFVIAWFALVWIANLYMSVFLIMRSIIKKLQLQNEITEEEMKK